MTWPNIASTVEPVELPLWEGNPPRFQADASDEVRNERGSIRLVSQPTISMYLPPQEIRTGRELDVPVNFAVFEVGAHGAGNLILQHVKHGLPPAKWPTIFLDWHASLN